MVRLACLAVVLAASAARTEPLPPTREVMATLHQLEGKIRRGEGDQARIELVARARERPGDAMPRVYLAWLTLPSDDAWNQLKAVATIFPENPWVHYGMGRTYLAWKMRDQVETEVSQVLKADPRFYPGHILAGDLKAQLSDWKGAEGSYRAALAIEPDPEARAGLGIALVEQGKVEEGQKELEQAIATFPEQPRALKALLPLLEKKGGAALVAAVESLVLMSPKDRDARRRLADLKLEQGDEAGAAAEYERLLRLGNPDAEVLRRAAGLYRTLGKAEDEERTLEALAALDAKSPLANLRLAELTLDRGEAELGEGHLLEALARDPGNVAARLRLSRLKEDQGSLHEALEHLRAIPGPARSEEVSRAITTMEERFRIPRVPVRGKAVGVYAQVASSLDRFYAERRTAKPGLAGAMRFRVNVLPDGTAKEVTVLTSSVEDPLLVAHVYFALKDAVYAEGRAVQPVFDFVVGAPPARKGK